MDISSQFEKTWNLSHIIGLIDGIFIWTDCSKNAGTFYHNYKGFCGLVLLAVCDANHLFTLSNKGGCGSDNDCGSLANSSMGKLLENKGLNLPSELKDYKFIPLLWWTGTKNQQAEMINSTYKSNDVRVG